MQQILSGCSSRDLNYVLLNITTAALVEVAGHHTMEMLTSPQQRLPELRVVTRCALDISALLGSARFRHHSFDAMFCCLQGGTLGCASKGGNEASAEQAALGDRDFEGHQGH